MKEFRSRSEKNHSGLDESSNLSEPCVHYQWKIFSITHLSSHFVVESSFTSLWWVDRLFPSSLFFSFSLYRVLFLTFVSLFPLPIIGWQETRKGRGSHHRCPQARWRWGVLRCCSHLCFIQRYLRGKSQRFSAHFDYWTHAFLLLLFSLIARHWSFWQRNPLPCHWWYEGQGRSWRVLPIRCYACR